MKPQIRPSLDICLFLLEALKAEAARLSPAELARLQELAPVALKFLRGSDGT